MATKVYYATLDCVFIVEWNWDW